MTEEVLVRVTGIQHSGQQPEENEEPISMVIQRMDIIMSAMRKCMRRLRCPLSIPCISHRRFLK